MTRRAQQSMIRRRYPAEGASDSLCRDLGMQAWQVRHYARKMNVFVDAKLIRGNRLRYTWGSTWEKR